MGYLELVAIAFVILGWIIRSIYRATKWAARRITAQARPLSPKFQVSIEDDEKPVSDLPPSRGLSQSRPQGALPSPLNISQPAVTREATQIDFSNAEQNLRSFRPSPLSSALDLPSNLPTPKQFPLFENTDDLVRAMILQEILSPPRIRRASSRQ